ncbi:myb/SANT-like domain, Harbinger transposase-derived nuclease domain protein [Artemisia annua]|uniref:Myb/SANT-like domain, Harbinger transposase-derived nuclease domain protein n=1 Tax=Artemisia annua TaxID=35608 RepID=A0A2U1QC93_ARTAN|nr:myb/SANT-like domain, Harbinger transposase-derived nuclease domain protein [Artemisia annua]
MKNGFDNLKAKYIGWLYLKNKTGNIYNPQTKMFNLTPEQWEDFKKIHKRAGSLQSNPLPYQELCEIVFQSISPNGDGQWINSEGSGASGSATSASGASAVRERVGAIDIDDDPLTNRSGFHDAFCRLVTCVYCLGSAIVLVLYEWGAKL